MVRRSDTTGDTASVGIHCLRALCRALKPVDPGSLAEFITEHYWGYTRRRDGKTSEYQVTHPRWNVSAVSAALLDCDIGAAYGAQYREALGAAAPSAFVAEGSPITVFQWGSIGSGPDRLTGE